MYVIEIKLGKDTAHFQSLAQVQAAARWVEKQEQHSVTPVLVTTQEVSPKLSEVAQEVGVELVTAQNADSAGDIAEALADRLVDDAS